MGLALIHSFPVWAQFMAVSVGLFLLKPEGDTGWECTPLHSHYSPLFQGFVQQSRGSKRCALLGKTTDWQQEACPQSNGEVYSDRKNVQNDTAETAVTSSSCLITMTKKIILPLKTGDWFVLVWMFLLIISLKHMKLLFNQLVTVPKERGNSYSLHKQKSTHEV